MDSPLIYCDKPSNCARAIMTAANTQFTTSQNHADLIWRRKNYRQCYHQLQPTQLLNHIPNEGSMIDKGNLTEQLHRYAAEYFDARLALKKLYPESFRLYNQQEYENFMQQLPKQDTEENLWILKPNNLSKGVGMKVLWDLAPLRAQSYPIDFSKFIDDVKGHQEYIIQRYIKDVLLIHGRKSEIRVYWLIANLNPLQVLMYHEGTVRITTTAFKLGDYDNPFIHITNTYQQKKNPEFNPKDSLKYSFTDLGNYIMKEKLTDSNHFLDDLRENVKKKLIYVVRACMKKLQDTPKKGLFFGLYGADFILDKSLNPWLAEIQKGPGLDFSDPIKKALIPPMFQEAINIVLEVQKKTRAKENLAKLDSVKHFEWLINEAITST